MERKPIPKKIRFEVFKRDNFTCQYCGKSAPEVVLEIDHIKPVSKGGDNNIINLITSCFDCNRGKGKRELKDDSIVSKQREQLKILNEKHQQLEMMVEWKTELEQIENEEIKIISDLFEKKSGRSFNDIGKNNIRKFIKKYGFEEVYTSMEISFEQYYKENDINALRKTLAYIERICKSRIYEKQNPNIKKINYLIKIAKTNLPYCDKKKLKKILLENYDETDFQNLKNIFIEAEKWKDLYCNLTSYYEE